VSIQTYLRGFHARKQYQKKLLVKNQSTKEYWDIVDKDVKVDQKISQISSGTRKSALLIIDVQNDFLPPEGSLAVAHGTEVVPVINGLRARVKFDHIALSQDWHPVGHVSFVSTHVAQGAKIFTPFLLTSGQYQVMWPEHCIQGTHGAKFHKDLISKKSDTIVQKGMNLHVDSYSAFFDNDHKTESNLAPILKQHGITDVYVTGIAFDYCVGYSALDSVSKGFRTYVVDDACRGVAPDTINAMKTKLQEAGVQIIQSTDIPESSIRS